MVPLVQRGLRVAMEAVYDPEIRSRAIAEGMKARVAKGELSQMLAEAGVELPQLDQGEGTRSRQGVLTRSQARTQQGRGGTQPQADKGNLDGVVLRDQGGKELEIPPRLVGSRGASNSLD